MDTSLTIRAFNLGLKVASNFHTALSEKQIEYYENNLQLIPSALTRGFIIESILQFVSTVNTSATTEEFVAKNKFIVDISEKAKVKISRLDSDFIKWFLDKTEEPIARQILNYHKLLKQSIDDPIIAQLGGKEVVETTLAEIYDLMLKQFDGEEGVLLNSGWANIFYVKDINGVLRAVIVRWRVDGWYVLASSVEIPFPFPWGVDLQVFSRNLVLKISGTSGIDAVTKQSL